MDLTDTKVSRIERRRCQIERDSARKVHEGISTGSGETGNGGGVVLGRGRPAVALPPSLHLLGESAFALNILQPQAILYLRSIGNRQIHVSFDRCSPCG